MKSKDAADIIIFDLDKTLSESKVPLDPDMSALLCALLRVKKVAVISGAAFKQFEAQFLRHLTCPPEILKNLFLLPTNGASLYEYKDGWTRLYHFAFTDKEKKKIFDAFEKAFEKTNFQKPEKTYGTLIEDRDTQITFSGLGSDAPLSLKEPWDPDHAKRKALAAALAEELPDFSISIGGATSIDVTRKGVDKAYGIAELMSRFGYEPKRVFYVGDALFPGGNDASVISLGVKYQSVEKGGVGETKHIIREILSKKIS
ncbi:MAG: HAD-IIB family hydrolase [Candidatus Lloydbacteria bacterium]|nr:HAD-IIB family hydrolase [Candidatus Lloydbacteria bacterium]